MSTNQQVIVFENLDGTVGVIHPNPALLQDILDPETQEVIKPAMTLEEMALKDVPNGLSWRLVQATDLPSDREFRAAWSDANPETSTVDIDMPKARDLYMEKIRKERNARLEALDVEQLKGVDVANQKQTLRDLPQTVDLSVFETVEALKAYWPNELSI